MDVIKENTVAALHRTMVVLREELEMRNKIILSLRRRKRYKTPGRTPKCLVSIEDIPLSHKTYSGAAQKCLEVNTKYGRILF